MAWRLSAGFALVVAFSGPAAIASPTAPTTMAGAWTIARTSEWPRDCSLTLLKAEAIGGFGVQLKPGCRGAFPWAGGITAWRMASTNELVLQDATRHGLVHFTRGEDQDWVGPGPDGQDYVIARPHPTRRRAGAR